MNDKCGVYIVADIGNNVLECNTFISALKELHKVIKGVNSISLSSLYKSVNLVTQVSDGILYIGVIVVDE